VTRLLLIGAAVAAVAAAAALAATPDERHVTLLAQKFDFTPETITLKKGQPVVLEVTSIDRIHGFAIPELKLRIDVLPTATTEVRLVPDRVGRFTFRCDNFCGDGHEEMEGAIVVEE
jgi:cytochrome c oxidase subunit 2